MAKHTWTSLDVVTKALADQLLYGSADGESADDLTKLAVKDQSGAGSFALELLVTETLTADRILTITTNNAARAINLTGNLTLAGNLTTTGAFNLILALSASVTLTLPGTNDTLVGLATSDILTNKTLTSPDINGGTADSFTSLSIRSTGVAKDLKFATAVVFTADRTLSITIPDAATALTLTGDLIRVGAHSLTLRTSGATDITLPTTGTVVTDAVATLSSLVSIGTITTGVWNATLIAVAYGGTGLATITDHAVMLGSGTGAVTPLGVGTTGKLLRAVTTADPAWTTLTMPDTIGANEIFYASSANVLGVIAAANSGVLVTSGAGVPSIATDIPTAVTIGAKYIYRADGTDVPMLDGGTGASLVAAAGAIPYSGAATMALLAAGSAGQLLRSGGAAAPTWTTTTFPATIGINEIFYASAANVLGVIAAANSGVLVTSGAGVPSIATDIPTAVTVGGKYNYRADGTDVAVADGGTGKSVYVVGDILYASAVTTIAGLADVAAGSLLRSGGVNTAPAWTTLTMPATIGINEMFYASAANVLGVIAAANSGVLVTSGAGVPSIATDIPTAVTVGGKYNYRADGTDVAVADGGTNISAYAVGDLITATAATTLAAIADVAVGQVLVSGGIGVIPAWSATPTFISSVQTGRGEVGRLNFKDETEITLDANGEATITQGVHNFDTNGDGATDDLQAIIGGAAGDILIFRPNNAARTIVAKHAGAPTTGLALNLAAGVDFTMDEDDDFLMLLCDGALWQEISRSENHA